jgi:hypothetical protein
MSEATIPRELLTAAPRMTRLTALGILAMTAAGVLLAGAGIAGSLLFRAAERGRARLEQIRRQAVWAPGEVRELGRDPDGDRRHFARFRYTVDGRDYGGRSYLGEREWRSLRVGAPVQAGYLPSDPGTGWLRGHEPEGVPFWSVPLAIAGGGIGAFVLLWNVRRQRCLLSEGRAAVARVTRFQRVRHGQHRRNRIHYEFKVLSGAARTGWYDSRRKPPPEGTELVILYDLYDHRRQARYPTPLVRTGG